MKGRSITERAKDAAEAYLERQGMQVIEADYPTMHGTIPLLAIDKGTTLVHVTVRARRTAAAVTPPPAPPAPSTIDTHHRRMIQYLAEHRLEVPVRFDVIDIMVVAEDRALLRHHLAAYTTDKET